MCVLLSANSKEYPVYAVIAEPGSLSWSNSRYCMAHGSHHVAGWFLIKSELLPEMSYRN